MGLELRLLEHPLSAGLAGFPRPVAFGAGRLEA
jgi:hypothetical protein